MELVGGITVGPTADAVVEPVEGGGDEGSEGNALGGLETDDVGKTLLPLRYWRRLQQLGAVALDDGIRHRPWPLTIPRQALLEGSVEPPADPLHRNGKGKGLGDGETEGAADVAGFKDDGGAISDRLLDLLLDDGFDLLPAAEDGGIGIELLADVGAADVTDGGRG